MRKAIIAPPRKCRKRAVGVGVNGEDERIYVIGGHRLKHRHEGSVGIGHNPKHSHAKGLPDRQTSTYKKPAVEEQILVATSKDQTGEFVWEKSSIVVANSIIQKKAFEAARKILSAKKGR